MFKEVVEIDVKGKTETFHVPLQGDLEAAEIINDFRKVSHCPDMTSKSVKQKQNSFLVECHNRKTKEITMTNQKEVKCHVTDDNSQ